VVKHFGGAISPENEPPKLLWLKRHSQSSWARARYAMDLTDFLTARATGSYYVRSSCTTACKWGRLKTGWSSRFWNAVGLEELALSDPSGLSAAGIGIDSDIRSPGSPIENGVCPAAAAALGLPDGTPVGVSLIDAHCGGLGMLGAGLASEEAEAEVLKGVPFHERVAMICGSSTCILAASETPICVPRVWGPFWDAMLPNTWLTEGGQSLTGLLLDHIIESHPSGALVKAKAEEDGTNPHDWLSKLLETEIENAANNHLPHPLAEFHVLPYFHGNRHPRADPTLRGAMIGLDLGTGVNDLMIKYGAALFALVYGARHLLEAMVSSGHKLTAIFATGSGAKNSLFVQTLADAVSMPVVIPRESESVVLGAAMLGWSAGGGTLESAITRMSHVGRIISPREGTRRFHDRKFQVFLRMYEDFMSYRSIMRGSSAE